MTNASAGDRGVQPSLAAIADRLERLAPSHRNPMDYHEEKSELVYELREMARTLEDQRVLPGNDHLRGTLLPGVQSLLIKLKPKG